MQKYCSSVLDELPYCGAAKKAIECKTGKDYITDEKLTPIERINRFKEVASGITDTLVDAFGLPQIPKRVKRVKKIVEILEEGLKNEIESDSSKNNPENKSQSKSRIRSRSRDKDSNKKGRKGKNRK